MTIFSRIADPAVVARRLRELAPDVVIDGPDANWRNAVVTSRSWLRKRRITLTHDPAYYAEPNWSTQMAGMRGYINRFPATERKETVMMLTTTLHFSLGLIFDPENAVPGDSRLDLVYAVVQLLDGVVFTPSSLRDAHGRILFGAGGEDDEDPAAAWPSVIAEVQIPAPISGSDSQPGTASDQNESAEAPSADRVARRALATAAVTKRACLEQDKSKRSAHAEHKNVLAWIEALGIGAELEPDEWEILQRPLGKLHPRQQIDFTWRLEGLAVLGWALRVFDMPAHDVLVKWNTLWQKLGLEHLPTAQALLGMPALRPRQELESMRKRLLALHWRLLNYRLHRKVLDFPDFAKTCWFGPLDVTGLPLIDKDLSLRGKRLDRASADAFSEAESAALERHKAANWLCEGPALFSEARVDT